MNSRYSEQRKEDNFFKSVPTFLQLCICYLETDPDPKLQTIYSTGWIRIHNPACPLYLTYLQGPECRARAVRVRRDPPQL
jgi:hypothetical protein